MYSKNQITYFYKIKKNQLKLIEDFKEEIIAFNKHTNIIGQSTLKDFWTRHVLDSLQLTELIPNRNSSILDMGTGAGIPGLFLAINNFTNVSLVDANLKKIEFLKSACL